MTDKKIKVQVSNDDDFYYSIENTARSEIKVKGSKFIATAAPVNSKAEAIAVLDTVKAEFHDASHHPYAYRIGFNALEFRSADDGEPSGSAGKPILFSIAKSNLSDIIVIVSRYFGGTKLGLGPLSRAFSEAATLVISNCNKKICYRTSPVKIFCTYDDLSIIKSILIKYTLNFVENYHDAVEIVADIPLSMIDEFSEKVTNSTQGRAGTIKI